MNRTGVVVATANVYVRLPSVQANDALATVLAASPDLVALQEWRPNRLATLRSFGTVGIVGLRAATLTAHSETRYRWWAPALGGCVTGARTDRFDPLGCRSVRLSSPGFADRDDGRPWGFEPGRRATVLTLRDLANGNLVSLVSYHLVSGVQRRGAYREDRPRLVTRHRQEYARLQRLVAELVRDGHDVYAAGDSNLDGFQLPPLVSAWRGRESMPGTYGKHRHIDDVFAVRPATSVETVQTPSDHRAVVVRSGSA